VVTSTRKRKSIRAKDYVPERLSWRRAEAAHVRLKAIGSCFVAAARQQPASFARTDLVRFLHDTTILVDAMTVYLGRQASKPPPRMQWWLVWITLIILHLRKNGNSVSWKRGRKKGLRKEFVHLIFLLQKHLPPNSTPRKTHESVQKGIVLAIRLTTGKPIAELETILKRWGSGEYELASKASAAGMSDPEMFSLARTLERIENTARA
jgi:hypothetical protein